MSVMVSTALSPALVGIDTRDESSINALFRRGRGWPVPHLACHDAKRPNSHAPLPPRSAPGNVESTGRQPTVINAGIFGVWRFAQTRGLEHLTSRRFGVGRQLFTCWPSSRRICCFRYGKRGRRTGGNFCRINRIEPSEHCVTVSIGERCICSAVPPVRRISLRLRR